MNVVAAAADRVFPLEENGAVWPSLSADQLDEIQWKQFQHDEAFHREITRLTVQQRLTHMALHFAKYSGYLAEAVDEDRLRKIVTDIFVIGVSTLTALNVKAHPILASVDRVTDTSQTALFRQVAIGAGHMASACERLDHLEDFPFRTTIRDATAELVALALAAADDRGWDMPDMVEQRLRPVKQKSILYDRIAS